MQPCQETDTNKVELFSFLSKKLGKTFNDQTKKLVITDGEAVIWLPRQDNESTRASRCQEEADTRIMMPVVHVAAHGHCQIQVRTDDTNVVVLAVMVSHTKPCLDALLILERARTTSLLMK